MSNWSPRFLSSCCVAWLVGCSLINAPEELRDPGAQGDGDGDTGDGDGDTGDGDTGDGDTGDGDTGGGTGDGDGDGSGGLAGSPGDGDGDGDTGGRAGDGDGDAPPPSTAQIVIAATDVPGGARVLSVLDGSGTELKREAVDAVVMAYDEAPARHLWYVFTSSRVAPDKNTLARLEMRRFDEESNSWQVLGSASALPPPLLAGHLWKTGADSPELFPTTASFRPVVLNNRLVYLSQGIEGSEARQALTVLDTTDPDDIQVIETLTRPTDEQVVGLVGLRDSDAKSDGGAVSVMIRKNCTLLPLAEQCDLLALPFQISKSAGVVPKGSDLFASYEGVPTFASTPRLPDSVSRPNKSEVPSLGSYAFVFSAENQDIRYWQFDPTDPAQSDNKRESTLDGTVRSFFGLAADECRPVAVVGARGTGLFSVHLANAQRDNQALVGDWVDLQFEPFRGEVLALKGVGTGPAVRAFQLEKIGTPERFAFAERSTATFSPPSDLDPISFAVREPEVPTCK